MKYEVYEYEEVDNTICDGNIGSQFLFKDCFLLSRRHCFRLGWILKWLLPDVRLDSVFYIIRHLKGKNILCFRALSGTEIQNYSL